MINIRTYTYKILCVYFAITASTATAQPSEHIWKFVGKIGAASAAIEICSEYIYNNYSVEYYIEINRLDIELYDIVEELGEKFDQDLSAGFYLTIGLFQNDRDFKKSIIEQYPTCGKKFVSDIVAFIKSAKSTVQELR